jgi:TPR repeat protein
MVLFQAAADMGEPGGEVALAYMHLEGLGVSKNVTAARLRFEAASTMGDPDACFSLGFMYGGRVITPLCRAVSRGAHLLQIPRLTEKLLSETPCMQAMSLMSLKRMST